MSKSKEEWAREINIQSAKSDQSLINLIDEIAAVVGQPDITIYLLQWRRAGYPPGTLSELCTLLMLGAIKADEADEYIAMCQAGAAFDPEGLCDYGGPK